MLRLALVFGPLQLFVHLGDSTAVAYQFRRGLANTLASADCVSAGALRGAALWSSRARGLRWGPRARNAARGTGLRRGMQRGGPACAETLTHTLLFHKHASRTLLALLVGQLAAHPLHGARRRGQRVERGGRELRVHAARGRRARAHALHRPGNGSGVGEEVVPQRLCEGPDIHPLIVSSGTASALLCAGAPCRRGDRSP